MHSLGITWPFVILGGRSAAADCQAGSNSGSPGGSPSPNRTTPFGRLVTMVVALLVGGQAMASDPPGGVKIQTFVRPTKSSTTRDRAAEFVQKSPAFYLQDGADKISPSGVGYICLVEGGQGNQVQVWIRSQGLRGWAAADALVPLNHAETFFSRQIEANPNDAFAYLMRGVVRFENDDLEHALADVDQSLKLDPNYVAALVERAYLWQCRNRLDLALADVNKAISLDSQNSYAYVERGVFHFTMKDYGKAQRDFTHANQLGSRAAALHLCQGMIHLERGEAEPAIAEFNVALRLDPKRLDAYLGLATVYSLRNDHNKALAVFNRAIEVDPKSADAYEARAIYFVSHGKADKALDDLDEAIRLDPASAAHLRSRARVCFEKGDFDRVLADLEAATRIDPNDAEAHQGRAWILATCTEARIRNGPQAVVSATKACELTGWRVPHGLATLAAAYSEAGDYASAAKCQDQALSLLSAKDPSEHEYRRLLARYKAGKPYHRVGLLEEMGVRGNQPVAKAGGQNPG
jgi:tetratricopeptide (TPR) repeat protein